MPNAKCYLGVDLGGTNIKAALVTADGEILKEASAPTNLPRTAESVCNDIAALCLQLAAGEQVAAIGVAAPARWMTAWCCTPTISTGTILRWPTTFIIKWGCLS